MAQRSRGRGSNNGKGSKGVFIALCLGTFTLILVIIAIIIGFFRMHYENVIPHVTIECGEKIEKSDFFESDLVYVDDAEFSVDLSQINTNIPQEMDITITILNKTFESKLTIADTLAPTCTVLPQYMYANEKVPDVTECVTDVYDIQQPVSIEYMTEPDLTSTNTSVVYCKLEDISGNINIVEIPFYITVDNVAPEISGTKDLKYYIGDTIQYRKGVTVTDDVDQNPRLEIDNSKVNSSEPGKYTVTYIAYDAAGNSSSVDIKLTLIKKPNTYIEPDVLYAEAQKVLNKITTSSMTDMEKALKIFRWCRYNIHYITSTDTSSWTRAAYDAIVKRQGTCYSFAMAARALLDCCGIPNRIVKRDPFRWSAHYWNLIQINGEWYHCDSTPRQHYHGYVFMMTDYELSQFRGGGYNGFSFKKSLYPKRSTTSVQNRINYETGTIKK